jgi:hypothetical protein
MKIPKDKTPGTCLFIREAPGVVVEIDTPEPNFAIQLVC